MIEESTFHPEALRVPPYKEGSPVKIKILSPDIETIQNRKFMHVKPVDKADALNRQIDSFAEKAAANLGISLDDFGQPASMTNAPITVVGRIVCEVEGTKLTENGILLETSRQIGSGCRIPLHLECPCSFFPGQLVVLEGSNPTGDSFKVTRQISTNLFTDQISVENPSSLSIILASGPFLMDKTGDSLVRSDFMPFEKLLNLVAEQKPHLLILQGPFINDENPIINAVPALPEEIFQNEFISRLKFVTSRLPSLRIALIPSQRDLISLPVMPQPPLKLADLAQSISCLPNPSFISVQDVNIALCSSELLLSLGMEEHSSMGPSDRLGRLCSYLQDQGSIYPLNPAPSGINLDYNHLDELQMPCQPDLVLLSSQLRCFAKSLKSTTIISGAGVEVAPPTVAGKETLYVNSGYFCRKQSPGTAAIIHLSSSATAGISKRVEFYQF